MSEAIGLPVDLDDDDVAQVVDVCGVVKYLDQAGTVTYQLFASPSMNRVEQLGMIEYARLFVRQDMEAEWFSFFVDDDEDDE